MQLLHEINQYYYTMSLYELNLLNKDTFLNGISYHTLLYINVINVMEQCTVSHLASALHITKSAVTLKINELEKQKIIYKQQSEKDKRIFYVRLHENAKKAMELYDTTFLEAQKKLTKQFSEIQLATFVEVMQSLAKLHLEVVDHE